MRVAKNDSRSAQGEVIVCRDRRQRPSRTPRELTPTSGARERNTHTHRDDMQWVQGLSGSKCGISMWNSNLCSRGTAELWWNWHAKFLVGFDLRARSPAQELRVKILLRRKMISDHNNLVWGLFTSMLKVAWPQAFSCQHAWLACSHAVFAFQ